MIKICSFFHLPIEDERIGPVYAISNTYPRQVGRPDGKLTFFVPPWELVQAFKESRDQEAFTQGYRQHLRHNWPQIKRWLDGLSPEDEMYLCCWERSGFCHRILVYKLIRKFRPDLEVRLT